MKRSPILDFSFFATLALGAFAACSSTPDSSPTTGNPSANNGSSDPNGGTTDGTGLRRDGGLHHDSGGALDGAGGGTDSSSGTDSGGGNADSGGGGGGGGGLFTQPNPWNKRIDALTKNAESDAIIQALTSSGGWGTGSFKMDTSIEVLTADATTPMRTFTATGDFYTPDCDKVPFPVPAGGALEGETGYSCTSDGDCHLLVVHGPAQKLYEMWRADINGSTFNGGCVAVWDLTKAYPDNLRGDGCTSADAGGFPITAMLATADEVAAGAVNHALRFILPNSRIRRLTYVHPGSHTTSTSGGANAPPYGVRFRLRANYPLASLPSQGARVLAIALQQYGMFLADGGNVPLTVRSDRSTAHTWASQGVDETSLNQLKPSDMEVVEMGAPIVNLTDCTRNP